MLRSRQRNLWLLGIATVWIVGVYVVYQKAVSNNLLNTWPKKLKPTANPLDEKVDQLLSNLESLESENLNRYKDLNKKFLYYIDKKFRREKEAELNDPEAGENKENAVEVNPLASLRSGTGLQIPVIVFACNRISVSVCLDQLLKYRPSAWQFPIIVSQDCGDTATRDVILSYHQNVTLIEHPDQSDIVVPPKHKKYKGYYKIARHYGWALNQVFSQGFDSVIIVEDDLNVAPDFFEYFLATHHLLKEDPTLWCISAWNDNGKKKTIDENAADLLYRTDFFPGLGWMLTRDLWNELSPKWPKSFWDDWIRNPEQRKGRSCVRPEISRTRTFGKVGVSNGMFFDKHLQYIVLSTQPVNFTAMDLSYLRKPEYDRGFLKFVYDQPLVDLQEVKEQMLKHKMPVRIQYNDRNQFRQIAKTLGLMDDFKSGVPRTAYNGVVSVFYNGQRIYVAPSATWKGYDPKWR